jgi:dipeptidyl-peptidase-4
MRESARGIVAYSADAAGTVVVFALSGRLFACEVATGACRPVPADGPCVDPHLDPAGTTVAYTSGRALRAVTLDGRLVLDLSEDDPDVSFGGAEFAAAEELGRHRGFWWSPDGRQVLAARVDVRDVTSVWLGDPARQDLVPFRQRYPRAGTANARVSLVLAAPGGGRVPVETPGDLLPYLAAARWDPGGPLTLVLLSRDQQRAEIRTVDPATGQTALAAADTDPAWLELTPGTPRWLPDGRLLRTVLSEDTRRLVAGDEPCTPPGLQVLGVVTAGERTVFAATREPTERHLFACDHATGQIRQLTSEPGVHEGVPGPGLLAVTSQTLERDGSVTRVFATDGPAADDDGPGAAGLTGPGRPVAVVRSLRPAAAFRLRVTLLTAGERALRTAVVLPGDDRRPPGPLPVIMDPYGGPLTQRVLKAHRLFCEPQWLADQGFAVVIADGRGSPARGPRWERAFRFDVATAALDDQVAALEHVARAYPGEVDTARVGIRGWSFGGYLAALAVLRRPDVFRAAVAGAPVTDWRYYDTAATERYLGHPGEHPQSYERTSLLPLAEGLTRPLLLVHGLADDNVHPRHSLLLAQRLLAAGRPHEVLLLPGVTHMVWQAEVIAGLLEAHADFFRRWLGRDAARGAGTSSRTTARGSRPGPRA